MKKLILIYIIFLCILCGCASKQIYMEYDVNLKKVIFCDQGTLETIYKNMGGNIPVHFSYEGKVIYYQLLGFYCPDIETAYILYCPHRPEFMHRIMGHELFRSMGFKRTNPNGSIDISIMEEK